MSPIFKEEKEIHKSWVIDLTTSNKMGSFNNIIKNRQQLKINETKKINLSQFNLTCQTRNLIYEIKITVYKKKITKLNPQQTQY